MKTSSAFRRFDGEHIPLDEPIELESNMKLIVAILPKDNGDWEAWFGLSAGRLGEAYGETEEDCPGDSITEANPEYEASTPQKSDSR